jgi:hypothetical protein
LTTQEGAIVHAIRILACLAIVARTATAEPPPREWTHVRPLTDTAASLLAAATRGSSIVRGLVADIEQTDVVVYLTDSMTGSEGEAPTYLAFVCSAGGTRYLVVRIDSAIALTSRRIALLAHELRHALEVAGAPAVVDSVSMGQLYRRIGWQCGQGRFETAAAVATGLRVKNQLAGFSW